jgi:hypothetical protein
LTRACILPRSLARFCRTVRMRIGNGSRTRIGIGIHIRRTCRGQSRMDVPVTIISHTATLEQERRALRHNKIQYKWNCATRAERLSPRRLFAS